MKRTLARTLARTLMEEFADSTGIRGTASPRRYLWTDAFAVSNFLELGYRDLALDLIDQVHHVLGRHRSDDSRQGWISGLSEAEGERHPTIGGLRIGKTLPERRAGEPTDPRLEWDRDGQYFHYLTRWMHTLRVASRETGNKRYLDWAVELARTAHRAFTFQTPRGGPPRMVWKMSIDLSRPLVDSMGHHDPLDGLIAALELEAALEEHGGNRGDLAPAIADFDAMCGTGQWATTDALGIGGLLDAAARLGRLIAAGRSDRVDLATKLLHEAEVSLQAFVTLDSQYGPAESRLAFRELGLAVGLEGIKNTATAPDRLKRFCPLAERIETFWADPAHRRGQTWRDHADINSVMLATSLAPDAYVRI